MNICVYSYVILSFLISMNFIFSIQRGLLESVEMPSTLQLQLLQSACFSFLSHGELFDFCNIC